MKGVVVFFVMMIVFCGCETERVYTPKPRMYPRVLYPQKAYDTFTFEACNFTFQKPAYAKVKTGIDFFGEKSIHPCWFDLEVPELKSSIHFSYNSIDKETSLQKLVTDAFKLAEQHNTRADYRDEIIIENQHGVKGLMFNIEGPVASPINFFLTDTTSHFIRASLYFNTAVNPDSIAPILDFMSKDIDKIISTFEWK